MKFLVIFSHSFDGTVDFDIEAMALMQKASAKQTNIFVFTLHVGYCALVHKAHCDISSEIIAVDKGMTGVMLCYFLPCRDCRVSYVCFCFSSLHVLPSRSGESWGHISALQVSVPSATQACQAFVACCTDFWGIVYSLHWLVEWWGYIFMCACCISVYRAGKYMYM